MILLHPQGKIKKYLSI